ncbi:hypothetical protein ACFTAO_04905 [Paenibacillus rhizoplanae]
MRIRLKWVSLLLTGLLLLTACSSGGESGTSQNTSEGEAGAATDDGGALSLLPSASMGTTTGLQRPLGGE